MGKVFKFILLLSLFYTNFAGTKISDLSQETNIQDTDEVIIRRGSNNYRVQVQHLPSANPSDQFNKIKNAYYISTNVSITDHADTAQSGSIGDVITNEMSGVEGDIILPGNKTYQIKQALTVPVTARLMPQKGAIIDTDISIRSASYQWTLSGSGTTEYYLEASGGGDPGINGPDDVAEDDSLMTEATVGSLSAGEWDWGDNDTLGYNTVYVRLYDSADPDGKAADYVEACYNLTINGPFTAGWYQTFAGNGRVVGDRFKITYPELWYDGGGDWEKAIENAALSLQNNGGIVQLSGQVYTVSLTTTNWIKIPSKVTIQGVGPSSIVKVANSNPDYLTIFGPNGASDTATSEVAFKDFKIDQNISNATGTVSLSGYAYHNCIHFLCTGSNFEVSGMIFDTCSGINPVAINAAIMTDVKIIDNIFKFERQSGGSYDTSTIYIHGELFNISGNLMEATISDDVNTAIEVHRGPGQVMGNTVKGYRKGLYLVSEAPTETPQKNSMLAVGNTFYDVNSGIALYSATGMELNSITVTGNTINLNQVAFNKTTTAGIWLYYDASVGHGDFRNIIIANNVISFTDEAAGRAGQTHPENSYGIGLNPYGNIYNIIVESNEINNAPSNGIRIGQNLSNNTTKDIHIISNTIVNAGNNINAVANNQRMFIFVVALSGQTMQNLIVKDNILRETNATLRADSAIYCFSGGTITDCYVGENTIHSDNGTMSVVITEEFSRMYAETSSPVSLTNYDCFNGKLFSNKGASGTIEFDLPDAEISMKVGFIRMATQIVRVDPVASDIIRGSGGVGKYLELDADGEIVWLECLQINIWDIVSSYLFGGTFEP